MAKLKIDNPRLYHCQWNNFRDEEVLRPDLADVEMVHIENSAYTFIEECDQINGTWLYRTENTNDEHNKLNNYHIEPKYYD